MKTALVPGSFDPITAGHLSLIKRAALLFDRVYVCVMQNDEKSYLFDIDERYALVRDAVAGLKNVFADKWDGQLWEYARDREINVIVKGIRDEKDAEYELFQARYNAKMLKGLQTVLLPAEEEYKALSSTFVRQTASRGGDLSGLVTEKTREALKNKQVEDRI